MQAAGRSYAQFILPLGNISHFYKTRAYIEISAIIFKVNFSSLKKKNINPLAKRRTLEKKKKNQPTTTRPISDIPSILSIPIEETLGETERERESFLL